MAFHHIRLGRRATRRATRLAALLALIGLPVTACAQDDVRTDPPPTASLALEGCEVPGAPAGMDARCGTLTVPLDRSNPDGETIDLYTVVMPATGDGPAEDPIFFIQGGPGGTALGLIPVAASMGDIHRKRDFVFVDQRGTGRSHPLDCGGHDLDSAFQTLFGFTFDEDAARACAEALGGADPAWFTTSVAVADLDAVRAALGYEQVNLWGGSYGTRVALEYARQFPDRARTLYLRGVAGTDYRLPLVFARAAQQALDSLEVRCERAETCAADTDLTGSLARITTRLEERPVTVSVPAGDGTETQVNITSDVFLGGIRFLLYHTGSARSIPGIVAAAEAGDFQPFVEGSVPVARSLRAQFSFGMTLAVVCSEDIPRIEDGQIEEMSRGTFLGENVVRELGRACEASPGGHVPAAFFEPVDAPTPTLAVSGVVDPVTPHWVAEEALVAMPDVVHLVFPEISHAPAFTPCVMEAYATLLDTGSTEGLERRCQR